MGYPYPYFCLCAFLGPYVGVRAFKGLGLRGSWRIMGLTKSGHKHLG